MTKKCIHCGIEKPVELFHKAPTNRDGYNLACKPCYRIYENRYQRGREKPVVLRKTLPSYWSEFMDMRGNGFSYAKIGGYYGFSKQYAHYIGKSIEALINE